MKRYDIDADGVDYEHPEGDFVKYEDVEPIVADRDIKAANLQLLVEKVLEYGAFASQFEDGPPYDNAGKDADSMWNKLVDLARSLKQ